MSETQTLLGLLRRHYIKPGARPGGVFVPECGINGRTGAGRRADALHIGFTSTSGRLLTGHEVKVSRSDWRKELDTAGKADFWADNCHAWYVVAPGPHVVPSDELPEGWGLMYPNPRTKTRMKIVAKATVHTDRTPSWEATRSIMARIDTLTAAETADRCAEYQKKAEADFRTRLQRLEEVAPLLTPNQRERLRALDKVEELLGASVDAWLFPGDGVVSAEVAAAALRIAHAAHQGVAAPPVYPSPEDLRERVAQMTVGVDAYAEARAALLALLNGTNELNSKQASEA